MKYYWIKSHDNFEEIDYKEFSHRQFNNDFIFGKSQYFCDNNLMISGDGRLELDYFQELVNNLKNKLNEQSRN